MVYRTNDRILEFHPDKCFSVSVIYKDGVNGIYSMRQVTLQQVQNNKFVLVNNRQSAQILRPYVYKDQ